MKINMDFIEAGLYNGTLNKAQIEILGQPLSENEDWKSLLKNSTLRERELSTKDINLFVLLRGKLSIKAQKQIIKNYQTLVEFHKKDKKEEDKPKEGSSDNIVIYCDGACKGNPGKSGSGLAIYWGNSKPTLLYGKYDSKGTNNTAELHALYKALLIAQESKPSKVTIYCDSKYSIDCISKWAYSWKSKGWTKKGGEIKNLEIIKLAHELYNGLKNRVALKHVKGHSGVEGNELADRMAVYAISSKSNIYKRYDYKNISEVLKL